jgi:hypothetical protein
MRRSEFHQRGFAVRIAMSLLAVLAFQLRGTAADPVTVGTSKPLREAIATAKPGTAIHILAGEYRGEMHFQGLQGSASDPIVITAANPAHPPVIRGGGEGLKFSSVAYLELSHLVVEDCSYNGLNIDDSGKPDQPSHHVSARHLIVRSIGSGGNDDGIKCSGVDDLVIEDCTFQGWGIDGQGVDLIGCHRGKVVRCSFDGERRAKVGIQIKGGSSDIVLAECLFSGIKARAVQIGGVTGLKSLRPGTTTVEAERIVVQRCTILGSEAPVVFASCVDCTVEHCVIHGPTGWVLRILHEQREPRFLRCARGRFRNNYVVWKQRELLGFVNAGPYTLPGTFEFYRNCWYCEDAPARSRPVGLPSEEVDGVHGEDPKFIRTQGGLLQPTEDRDQLVLSYRKHAAARRWRSLWVLVLASAAVGLTLSSVPLVARVSPAFRTQLDRLLVPWLSPRFTRWASVNPPRRIHFSLFLLVWLAGYLAWFIVWLDWSSGWPPRFPIGFDSPNQGWDSVATPEAIAIALYFLPVGICAGCLSTLEQRTPGAHLGRLTLLVGGGLLLWVCSQFPAFSIEGGAARSMGELLAAIAGSVGGAGIALRFAPRTVPWIRRSLGPIRAPRRRDWVLLAYVAGIVFYLLFPFDFIIRPAEIYHKLLSGQIEFVPDHADGQALLGLLGRLFAFLPVGIWAAVVCTSPQRAVRSWLGIVLLAVVLTICLGFLAWAKRGESLTFSVVLAGLVGTLLGAVPIKLWYAGNIGPSR